MHGSYDDPPIHDDRLDISLFARYLQGEAGEEEIRLVEQWARTEERRRWIAESGSELSPQQAIGAERVWALVAAEIEPRTARIRSLALDHHAEPSNDHPGQPGSIGLRIFGRRKAWYMTAGLAMVLVGLAIGRLMDFNPSPTAANTRYTTANGQRATVDLPDGSHVVLSVASQLDVPMNYNAGNRALRLSGEAAFTVAARQNTPFTVTTASVTARVLGTHFAVRHYKTDTATTVAVRDGKVAVRTAVLSAQQQVEAGEHFLGIPQPAAPSQFSFANGVLTLRNVFLRDAILDLNRWYDVDIRLGNTALGVRKIGGGFKAGSVTDLIAILEMTFDVRVLRDGRVLTINPR